MNANLKKDPRDKLWARLEANIQTRASKKDRHFKLSGPWKKFVRRQNGFKIYAVDGTWIRVNLSVIFGHGGHGLVHEFIPLDEIWIARRHYWENPWSFCDCKGVKDRQPVSRNWFDSCVLHEIDEFRTMKKSSPYWPAHRQALKKEKRWGLIKDPFSDVPLKKLPRRRR